MGKSSMVDVKPFRVGAEKRVRLAKLPTRVTPLYSSKAQYREALEAGTKALADMQERLYADDRYSLLVIFQAMDSAGKDGAIRHVMSGVNPQGCQVFSFKHPSAEELDHDFMWRTHRALPERGRIGIFNRSYYEEVLIAKVRPEILAAQKLPEETRNSPTFWEERYRSIRDSESHLHRNGTRVVKIFLHLSREEQRQRLLARLNDPEKNWKFSGADLEQRKSWDDYMKAYEACIEATSTKECPWYVVPADDKLNARLIVSQIVTSTLSKLDVDYPKLDKARLAELDRYRALLEADGDR
jgi:PPK2 family polyphosphate:nucleotide phosphotransferase